MKTSIHIAAAMMLMAGTMARAQLPAFPGAEGYGAYATGGRGGDVYHVTNLNSSGAGSFFDAISTVPPEGRTIVFDVSGYIRIPSGSGGTTMSASKVTIAGQTAPGDGIGFYNNNFNITGDNVVMRHLRFRRGHTASSGDCIDIDSNNDTMMDHLSVAFSTDENISSFGTPPTDLSFQYSLNSWGLEGHSAGGLWDQNTATAHHNLWAYNHTRNPKARPGMLEWINNVTFDWDIGYIMGDTQTSTDYKSNVMGNYWIGPPGNTHSQALVKGTIADNGKPNFTVYLENNLIDVDGDGVLNGVDNGYGIVQGIGYAPGTSGLTTGTYGYYQSPSVLDGSPAGVAMDSPLLAYKKVVSNAGALRLDSSGTGGIRDQVDTIMMNNLVNQTHISNYNNSSGDPQVGITDESQVGGLGTLDSAPAPVDTDQDGIPDKYENAAGMNAGSDDHNTVFSGADIAGAATFFPTTTPAGYTYLEEYLYFMASPHTYVDENTAGSASYVDIDLSRYTSGFTKPSVLFTVGNVVGGAVSALNSAGAVLGDGHTVRFTPTQETTGRAWFDFTVTDGDGESWTQRFFLIVTTPQSHPQPPTGLSASGVSSGRIDLSWTASSGADSYSVKRASVSGGPYTTVAAGITATSYADSGLDSGTTYHYVVRAVAAGNESTDSSEASATTLFPILQDAGGDGTVSIEAEHFDNRTSSGNSWEPVSDASYSGGEAMEASPDLGSVYDTGYESTSPRLDYQINFTHTGTHYVWILGLGPLGTGSDDSVYVGLDGTGLAPGDYVGSYPASLTWFNTLNAGGVATINVATTGIHTLNIWMREDGFILDKVLLTGNASYTPTGAGPAETARDTQSSSSSPPAAPTYPMAEGVSASRILLWWTASPDADSYTVKRGTSSGGPYATVASGITERVYCDTNLNLETTYYYVVDAVNTNGTSGDSAETHATTLGTPPAPPANVSVSAATTEPRIDLSWTASAGADSYTVYRSTTSGSNYAAIATGLSTTSYADSGVTSGTTYFYVVGAINANGESPASAEVHATPPLFQAIPVAVANSVSGTGGTGAVADGSGLVFSTASFDMNGGNAVAFMVTCEGAGGSSARNAYFSGQLMDKVDVVEGIQSSTLFYLVNPGTTSGPFSYYLDSGVSTDYAYSQISLSNVVGVAGSDTLHTTSDSAGTPVDLTYSTSTAGGFVLTSAVNNDYNYARKLSVAYGNPDTVLMAHTVYGTFGSFYTYGAIATAGSYTDGYYGQYQRTAIATLAFNAESEAVALPSVAASFTNGVLSLDWPGSNTGWILQSTTNLTEGHWVDVPGSESNSTMDVGTGSSAKYFRLRYPQ